MLETDSILPSTYHYSSARVQRLLTLVESPSATSLQHTVHQIGNSSPKYRVAREPSQENAMGVIDDGRQPTVRGKHTGALARKVWQYNFLPTVSIDKSDRHWDLRVHSPSWWSPNSIYELVATPRLSAYVFRTYNIVSHDSEIMRAISDGDASSVRRLFQDKAASPYDVSQTGESLLHVSPTATATAYTC
ncbi:hypothetical protein LIA77_00973 [Sarocladium implicatum]|nr:hypothetical protein LIA77_00973 [Sarocladium implicatum]